MLKLLTPDQTDELRQFGLVMMWVFPLIFMLLLPWLFSSSVPWWPAALSGILACLYLFWPGGLYYPYRGWMMIALVLGWINTRIILGLAFFALILPIGLLLRLTNKLQYRRGSFQPQSNWVDSDASKQKHNLKEPF